MEMQRQTRNMTGSRTAEEMEVYNELRAKWQRNSQREIDDKIREKEENEQMRKYRKELRLLEKEEREKEREERKMKKEERERRKEEEKEKKKEEKEKKKEKKEEKEKKREKEIKKSNGGIKKAKQQHDKHAPIKQAKVSIVDKRFRAIVRSPLKIKPDHNPRYGRELDEAFARNAAEAEKTRQEFEKERLEYLRKNKFMRPLD